MLPSALRFCAIPQNHVDSVDLRHEFRDLPEPELAVAIREKNKVATRFCKTAPQGCAVSPGTRVANDSNHGMPRSEAVANLRGRVGAAIVHDENLKLRDNIRQRAHCILDGRGKILRVVAGGEDQGKGVIWHKEARRWQLKG